MEVIELTRDERLKFILDQITATPDTEYIAIVYDPRGKFLTFSSIPNAFMQRGVLMHAVDNICEAMRTPLPEEDRRRIDQEINGSVKRAMGQEKEVKQ